MAAASSRTNRSQPCMNNAPILFHGSISPSGTSPSSSLSIFASSSSTFSPRSPGIIARRSSSPTRVTLPGSPPPSHRSVHFSITDHPTSPSRSISASRINSGFASRNNDNETKKTCMCSPTTHPGSFRCGLHRDSSPDQTRGSNHQSNRLNARRSAMTNSLVRIGTVEGEWVKRALAALVRPSSHQQRRRAASQPRPSRLSVMSMAEDPCA